MAERIRIKRGLKSQLPILLEGELAFCTDTFEVYIGSSEGNKLIAKGMTQSEFVNIATSKTIVSIDSFTSLTTWALNRGTNYFIDSINTKDAKSITMTGNGVDVAIRSSNRPTTNLASYTGCELRIYIADVSKLAYFTVYLATDENFVKFATYDFNVSKFSNGWNVVHFDPKKPSWSTGGYVGTEIINTIQLLASPAASQNVTMVIDDMSFINSVKGNVIFTFDDNWNTQYSDAFPTLSANGIKGNIAAISSMIGTANRMTQSQLEEVYMAGWDIINHTHTHPDLSTLTKEQQRTEIVTCKNYLLSSGFIRGTKFIAYPFGGYNTNTTDVLTEEGFLYGRTIIPGVTSTPPLSPYKIKTINLIPAITVAQAKAEIDLAIASATTVIFLAHRFAPTDDGSLMFYPTTQLNEIAAYAKLKSDESKLNIMTISEFIRRYKP